MTPRPSMPPMIAAFPGRHWPGDPPRSRWVSPLYVQRYVGPRWGESLSHHGFWELTHTLRGQGRLVGRVDVLLKRGRTILIPPGYAHDERASRVVDTVWIGLRGRAMRGWPTETPTVVESETVDALVRQLWRLSCRGYEPIGAELDGLTQALVARLTLEMAVRTELIDRVVDELHRSYAGRVSVDELAERMGVSAGHLHRAFKRRTGRTPLAYLTQVRMDAARQLLRRGRLPVREVARLVGYADPLYFSRAYRGYFGLPPSQEKRG